MLSAGQNTATPSGLRWPIGLAAIGLIAVVAVVTMLIVLNLKALEENRLRELQSLGQSISRTTVDFLLLNQYDQLLDWMNLLTRTSPIAGMALFADNEAALHAGTHPLFLQQLEKSRLSLPQVLHLEQVDSFIYLYIPLTQHHAALKRREVLFLFFNLETLLRRNAQIRLAVILILALSLGILVLLHFLSGYQRRLHERNQLLLRIQRELEKEEKTKSVMIRAISHHAMQFLTAIYGRLFLLLEQKQSRMPPAELEQGLKIIRENTDALKRTLENLKDNERLAQGQVKSLPRSFALVPLVSMATASFETTLAKQGLLLQCSYPPEEVHAWADPELVKPVLMNLLDNAVKFSPPGGTIRLIVTQDEKDVHIRIQDQGPGIAPADRERVFVPYTRLLPDKPGTGLGLSNSRQLLRLLGGELIVAESASPQGATLLARLPRSNPDK
ncbi:HAMP domain-containing histidine kinase, partial [candidate division FCPU426 bacterium]|nr:HAMP domain-containing histidine kinase [candidate division FCPU426 bacterium]